MKKILATALLCAAIATPALAQKANHWYMALDAGTLQMKNTDYANPGSLTVSGGYRFSPNFALEGGLTGYGDSTLVYNNGTTTAEQGDARFLAVGILPLSQSFELFGKAGGGPACATLYLPRTLAVPDDAPFRYSVSREAVRRRREAIPARLSVAPEYFAGKARG